MRSLIEKRGELVLTGPTFESRGQAARQFDLRLRQATGIAKAPDVADIARMFLEDGERVIILAWHREVWAILAEKLQEFGFVMYTGEESPKEKERSLEAFKKGEAKALGVSLGSCEGMDGLQECCATVIHAELALTAMAHEQGATRVDRPGQTRPTYEVFCISDEGSDPTISQIIGVKREQNDGVLNAESAPSEVLTDGARVKAIARDFLKRHGIVLNEERQQELLAEAV